MKNKNKKDVKNRKRVIEIRMSKNKPKTFEDHKENIDMDLIKKTFYYGFEVKNFKEKIKGITSFDKLKDIVIKEMYYMESELNALRNHSLNIDEKEYNLAIYLAKYKGEKEAEDFIKTTQICKKKSFLKVIDFLKERLRMIKDSLDKWKK